MHTYRRVATSYSTMWIFFTHELCDQHPGWELTSPALQSPFMPPLVSMLQGNHCPDLHTWEMKYVLFGVYLHVGFSTLIWAVVIRSCLLHYSHLFHDSLSIVWLMDVWIVSSAEALQIVLLGTFSYRHLMSTYTCFCWVYTYAGHRRCLYSTLGDIGRNMPIPGAFCLSMILILFHYSWRMLVLYYVLFCISLMVNWASLHVYWPSG